MAETSRRMRKVDLLSASKKWRDGEASPDRVKIWRKEPAQDEPDPVPETDRSRACLRAPVVYYLSLNGQLQHPHFIEVPFSSSQGLYLRDFINRLDQLRGKGMASIYSWSSKRRYNNGFVWHDLAEDDPVYPSHGNEYILKGSELLKPSPRSSLCSYPALSNPRSIITSPSPERTNFKETARRRNQSLSSIDFRNYRFHRSEWMGESTPTRAAADAWTQTGDWRKLRTHASDPVLEEDVEDTEMQQELQPQAEQPDGSHMRPSAELSKEDISPPLSDSSRETLESPIKPQSQLILCPSGASDGGSDLPGARLRASSVLMQLISCGSIPFKDCGPSYPKEGRTSQPGHSGVKVRRGGGGNRESGMSQTQEALVSSIPGSKLENKEYFSGSLVETRREAVGPLFKRSASHNAWR